MTTATQKKPEPRRLDFQSFDEVIADVRQLELGYDRAGQWTLGQNADHLVKFMRFSLEGFPGFHLPGPLTALVRRYALDKKRLSRPMPRGMRTPAFLRPDSPPEGNMQAIRAHDHAAAERLVEMLKRVKYHAGEWHPSPLLGRLTPAMWRLVHLKHASHHLGFLVPQSHVSNYQI